MNDDQTIERIRKKLGKKLLMLGHHYQRSEVLAHCDLTGDSFQLSAAAARRSDCESIVFCGVHFMAETADILANGPEQRAARNGRFVDVVLPDLAAGCSMADMASIAQVEECWRELAELIDVNEITPITYVNSSAALKAFCGRNGGYACTSSNARAVLQRALSEKPRVLFFPDQHLGRNTALAMGIAENRMPVWNPDNFRGGILAEEIKKSTIILWNGFCCVHQRFLPEHVRWIRETYPGIRIIVHPECPRNIVELADLSGSTSKIIQEVENSPPGSQWAIGTEWKLVERLIARFPDKTICNLAASPSVCQTMDLINLENVARALEGIESGQPRNVIRVEPDIAENARICLERMLSCS